MMILDEHAGNEHGATQSRLIWLLRYIHNGCSFDIIRASVLGASLGLILSDEQCNSLTPRSSASDPLVECVLYTTGLYAYVLSQERTHDSISLIMGTCL